MPAGKRAPLDDLIARVRARAEDPERRVEVRASAFYREMRELGPAALFGRVAELGGDLSRLLSGMGSGRLDPGLAAKAEGLGSELSGRVMADLPPVVEAVSLEALETAVGRPVPAVLRRVYLEVANGGFGPGEGLKSVADALGRYRELRAEPPAPEGCAWPEGVLPLVEEYPGLQCVDVATGRVLRWDPEELEEDSPQEVWAASFSEIAPSVEAWLEEWLGSLTQEERTAKLLAASQVEEAKRARATIAAMTLEQRRAMGLPDEGWEKVVWGGLGLEDEGR